MQVVVRITSLWIWWIAVASRVTQLFNQSTIVCASLMTEGPVLRARNGSLLLSLGSGGHNRYGKGTWRFELSKHFAAHLENCFFLISFVVEASCTSAYTPPRSQ